MLHWIIIRETGGFAQPFYGPCGAHVVFIPGIRFSILNELTFQVTWLQMMRHPLHLYVGVVALITNTHLPNYYETGWINLLDESSPSKYWPVSIYQVGITSVCYVYQKIVILMIPHTNVSWFHTRILKCLMIPHKNIAYPRRLSVSTQYLSLSLTHFTPTNHDNHFI